MPFQSEKQRRYLWANEPKIARDWADTYGSRIKKDDGGIMNPRLVPHTGADLLVKNTATGERPKYQPPGGGETSLGSGAAHSSGGNKGGGNKGGGNQPGGPKNQSSTAQKQQQYDAVKNLQAAMKGQGSGSGAGDYVKMHQHLKDPEKFDAPEIKKTFKDKFQQKTSDYRKKELRKLFDYIHGGRKMQFPGWSSLTRTADWDDDEYLGWNPLGASLHGDMSEKDLQKLQDLQVALGQDNLSQTGKFKGDNKFAFEDFYPNVNQHPGGGGGDGQGGGYMGYPSYEAWKAAQGAQGAGATTATAAAPVSAFQQSLTAGANNPFDYYVGKTPGAQNLAWGKKMGVDPRTMGLTSFAADGGRIPAAFGGIMDSSTGRRAYGFGSIFKKIGRAAKKVFKSPIGKAALGIGALKFAPAFMGQYKGGTGFGGMFNRAGALGKYFTKDNAMKEWSLGKLGIGAASALPFFMGGEEEDEGSKFDYMGAKNAYADEIMRLRKGVKGGNLTDEATQAFLPVNYGQAEGGRIGYYAGGQSTPSDYTMEDAMMTTTQDKLGGITDVMKQADLNRQGSVGQFYAANGGSADAKLLARVQELQDEGLDYNSAMAQALKELSSGKAQGGRIGAQEGGLMDLGGMEKDYRNDGGFVPLGGEEKADDVPARLSKNEFVFTADAVRGAGDGDIDKGAEIMENIMKNLEQGGQISEETQGLSGAQEMFGVSERLSEVV